MNGEKADLSAGLASKLKAAGVYTIEELLKPEHRGKIIFTPMEAEELAEVLTEAGITTLPLAVGAESMELEFLRTAITNRAVMELTAAAQEIAGTMARLMALSKSLQGPIPPEGSMPEKIA